MRISSVISIGIALLLTRQADAQAKKSLADAPTQLQHLLDRDAAARKANDSFGRLTVALQLRTFLNDASGAILAAAHAYSVVKDSAKVFETLTEYARLGLTSKAICNGEDKKFAWLAQSPGFAGVCRLIQENQTPVTRATPVLNLPDSGFLTEDIDYDKATRSFFFTSILKHAIYRITGDGNCRKFAAAPDDDPMMALKIDNSRGLVWATEVALPGFGGQPDSATGRSAVCCFDLHSGKLLKRIPAPAGAQWGDMTLDAQGNPIVCDGQSGAIFRLQKEAWQRIDKGDFISPQTPVLSADGKSLIVPDYERGLARLNIATGATTWIKNNPNHPCALNGVDGVYQLNARLFLTQNGVEPERVLEIQLDKDNITTTCTLIEKATPALGEPTHGVIVDGNFYFIANSGWDVLDRHGNLKPGTRMSPPTLMRYRPATSSSPP